MLNYVKENWWQVLLMANYVLVIYFSVLIVLKNRNPVKTISYLFALAALPFLGLIMYYFVGQDYRKDKIFTKKYFMDDQKLRDWRSQFRLRRQEKEDFKEKYGEGMFKIYSLLRENEKAVLTFDNQVDILVNGDVKYKRLKEDLENAGHHIHLEYFVVFDDPCIIPILDTLCKKAEEGVEVRFIYDDVGSRLSGRTKKKLDQSGVMHFPFMPVLYPSFTSKLNYRDHRKIVVIDGHTGYVGGINLNEKYDNSREDCQRFWRDTHLRIEGAAVGSLQASFLLSWDFVSNTKMTIEETYFPEIKEPGPNPVAVQIAASGPDTDWANIMEAMFTAINSARDFIYITSPYLIPNDAILTSLTTASRSGVDVRIIIPYESDSWAAQYATDSYIEELVKSKVRIYRYKKGFIHAKSMVIDDIFASIGTANLDYRSFSINFEINALLYSREKALEVKSMFMQDLEHCAEIEPERWMERGLSRKLKESFNRLWAPLL
jgi:cardiolipin synthase